MMLTQARSTFSPIDLGRLQNSLRKEVLPFGSGAIPMGNVSVVPNNDPVLRYLSQYGDERAYIAMEESEPKIYDAWRHRITKLLSTPTEVQLGKTKSAGATLLKDFAIEQLKRIRRWHN